MRFGRLRRPQAARRGSGPPSEQQDPPFLHAKRARLRGSRGFLQLTRCKSHHRPVCRGVAPGGGGRPARVPTSARTPLAPAVLAGCAREGDQGPLAAHDNMMSNVLDDACRLQDVASMPRTRRLQKIAARFCPGAVLYASLCICLYRGPSAGPYPGAYVWCTCGRGCAEATSECTRCLYVTSVYVEALVV